MSRINLENLNITLKGYPPEAAQHLAAQLPDAIAQVIDHRNDERDRERNARPNTRSQDLAGDIARQLVRAVREKEK